MASDTEDNLRFEIGHVLFLDLVGYSKLLIDEQKEHLRQLTDIVLATRRVTGGDERATGAPPDGGWHGAGLPQ